jgi:hypothetical protein
MKNDLQKDFNNWALENEIDRTVKFTPEQKLAYEKGKDIRIIKDKDELIINNSDDQISVKYIQDQKTIQNRLSNDDMNELIEGRTVTKVNSFEGEITSIDGNDVTLKNEKYGEMTFSSQNNDLKVGDLAKAELQIIEKQNSEGISYKDESYKLTESESKSEASYSTLQMDDNLKIHEVNPENVLKNIESINKEKLNEKQKIDLIKGRKVNLDDDEIEIFPKEKKGIKGKKLLLLASFMVAGPVAFTLVRGTRMAIKKNKENSQKLSKKEGKRLDELYKSSKVDYPNNDSLKNEYDKMKAYREIEAEFRDLNIETTYFDLEDDKVQEKIIVNDLDDLYDDLNTKLKSEQNVNVKIRTAKENDVANINLNQNSPFLKDKELFKSFVNSKNSMLFEGKNMTNKDLKKSIEKITKLTETKEFKEKLDQKGLDNTKQYIASLRSIALQKSQEYPENKQIKRDINTLSKTFSNLNTVKVEKVNKGRLSNVNDNDIYQDAKRNKVNESENTEQSNKVKKQTFKKRSL